MKKILVLALVLAIALPMGAHAATSCTSQFGTCTATKHVASCSSSAAKPTSSVTNSSTAGAQSGTNMSAMAAQVLAETNSDRAKAGLAALTLDADLSAAACVRAKEIVQKFSHTRPNGQKAASLNSQIKAENIAKGQQTASKVMAAWMSSAGHRRNILRKSSTKIGICAYRVNGIMYWVQLFN